MPPFTARFKSRLQSFLHLKPRSSTGSGAGAASFDEEQEFDVDIDKLERSIARRFGLFRRKTVKTSSHTSVLPSTVVVQSPYETISPKTGIVPMRRRRVKALVFPNEIFDEIASSLESPSDLRSLALTCKRLSDVVFSRHMLTWNFGPTSNNKPGPDAVWTDYAKYPGLAHRVRYLQIRMAQYPIPHAVLSRMIELRKSPPPIPESTNSTDTGQDVSDGESSISVHSSAPPGDPELHDAIANMTQLISFVVNDQRSEPYPARDVHFKDVWTRLKDIPSLTHLSIVAKNISFWEYRLELLKDLQKIRIVAESWSKDFPYAVRKVVQQSPALQSLILNFNQKEPFDLGAHFYNHTVLSKLEALALTLRINSSESPPSTLPMRFFWYLHALTALHIDLVGFSPSAVQPIEFPSREWRRLRTVSGDAQVIRNILFMHSQDSYASERPLRLGRLANIIIGQHFWKSLKGLDIAFLRELKVEGFESVQDVIRFGEEFSDSIVTALTVDAGQPMWDKELRRTRVLSEIEWIMYLSPLQRLQHLHGIPLLGDPGTMNGIQARLNRYLPHLSCYDRVGSDGTITRRCRR